MTAKSPNSLPFGIAGRGMWNWFRLASGAPRAGGGRVSTEMLVPEWSGRPSRGNAGCRGGLGTSVQMRSLRALLMAVVAGVVLFGCSSEPEARVLFVGNSYTSTNDLPGIVHRLAASTGHNVEVEVTAPGGWWWRDHAAGSTGDLISSGEFDFVVFQEQSMVTAAPEMARRESRPPLVDMGLTARMTGAKPILFMTWGHRNGSSEVGHGNYDSMQQAITATYHELADAVIGEVAPVGTAWSMTLEERPDIALHQADGSHPTQEGSYLAAAVITATILDIDPTTIEDNLDLDKDTARVLRGFANRAITR